MHDTAQETNRLALEGSGGAALRGDCGNADRGTRLVLREPRLKALDLHHAPFLEELDLRACGGPQFHLVLDDLPRLREVYLPACEQGCIVHLASPSLPMSLRVHGTVAEFDADWGAGNCRLASAHRPWKGIRLLGCDASLSDLVIGHRLADTEHTLKVVLESSLLPPCLTLTEPGTWLLAAPMGLERLTIDGPERVVLEEAEALQRLEAKSRTTIKADGLRALETVLGAEGAPAEMDEDRDEAGTSNAASMPGDLVLKGALHELDIAGDWASVQLHSRSLTRLSLERARYLALHHCRRLDRVELPQGLEIDCHGSVPSALLGQARFYVDEATVLQTLERLKAGEADLLATLLTLLPQRTSPHHVLHGLLTLEQLCDLGLDPQAIWECRRTLSAHHLQGKRSRQAPSARALARADLNWQWEFPRDRVEEGMAADLRVWRHCQGHCEQASAYRDALLGTCGKSPESLRHLLRVGLHHETGPVLRELMFEAMTRLYGHPEARSRLGRMASGLVRKTVALFKRDALDDESGRAALGFIFHEAAWDELPRLVPRLMRQRASLVRDGLMTLSRRPDEWFKRRLPGRFVSDQAIRSARLQLTQLALMPARPMTDDPQRFEEVSP
ncbi:hypothetical protein [Halomonas koreensis]|uniref:CHAD domain-containing protein n=1 Tax=Halomonas koreensis TaxID=245385 RepID=A0ABU1G5C6_9GAMM|nr:hypothetical protein [Halomonas koreensis]MDR5868154.1 hypothetical protein [Halomonas koreensis]